MCGGLEGGGRGVSFASSASCVVFKVLISSLSLLVPLCADYSIDSVIMLCAWGAVDVIFWGKGVWILCGEREAVVSWLDVWSMWGLRCCFGVMNEPYVDS